MEWTNGLRGKTVGLDTAPVIYFIEENPTYLDAAKLLECLDGFFVPADVTVVKTVVVNDFLRAPEPLEMVKTGCLDSGMQARRFRLVKQKGRGGRPRRRRGGVFF